MARFLEFYQVQYKPGISRAHCLDARFKVLLTGTLSIAVWGVESFLGLGIILCLIAAWIFLLDGQARAILSNLKSAVYVFFLALLYYGWSEYESGNGLVAEAVRRIFIDSSLLTVKLALVFIAAFWLYFSTAPMKVVDALGWFLKPLEKFRVPVGELAFTVGLVIRFFPVSVGRIGDLYRNIQLREKLAGDPFSRLKRYRRAVDRVIDTMVLFMHYSFHEGELLSLSLLARGYNPFRPVRLNAFRTPAAWEVLFFIVSALVIILTALWL